MTLIGFHTCSRLGWLFKTSTDVSPSVYLSEDMGSHDDRFDRVYGGLRETLRVKTNYGDQYTPLVAYSIFRYGDTGNFYDKVHEYVLWSLNLMFNFELATRKIALTYIYVVIMYCFHWGNVISNSFWLFVSCYWYCKLCLYESSVLACQ